MIRYQDLLGNPYSAYSCSRAVRVALNRTLAHPLTESDLPSRPADGAVALAALQSGEPTRWVPVASTAEGAVILTRNMLGPHVYLDLGNGLALTSGRHQGVYATPLEPVLPRALAIYRVGNP